MVCLGTSNSTLLCQEGGAIEGGGARGVDSQKKDTRTPPFADPTFPLDPRPQEARKQIGDVANKATAQLKTVADAMGTKPAS